MNATEQLLEAFRAGIISRSEAAEKIHRLQTSVLPFATIDTDRELRTGMPEVIYGEGKNAEQVEAIARELFKRETDILITRIHPDAAESVLGFLPEAHYDPLARTLVFHHHPLQTTRGVIAVVTAGTSDIPVAREALITAGFLGNRTLEINDVGVAGIHRLFDRLPEIRQARVVIVVAGMEGALASVVAGLVNKPVIAVPTSVGYGAGFQGLSALLGMLNSCSSGLSVVNIDNGYGAGCQASMINKLGEDH